MAEPSPSSSPVCFVSEDPSRAVIVDEPDLAALIDFHAGVTVGLLVEEEAPAVIANDSNHMIDLIGALLLRGELVFCGHVVTSLICSLAVWREAMTVEVDLKGRPIDQKCKHCGKLFTANRLRKHLDSCKGPEGMRVCDLSGAARARRVRLLFSPKKKKKKGRSVFAVNGGAFGLGKSRKH